LQTRGPNYNWKFEAEHLLEELQKTRSLLKLVESSSERLVYDLLAKLAQHEATIAKLEAERNLAKEALVFYADKKSWLREPAADVARSIIAEDCSDVPSYSAYTGGAKARVVLEKLKEKKC
jgi:serine/threonine-protein kinase RIO1